MKKQVVERALLSNKDLGATEMYQSEFCDVTYLEELNVVFVHWKKFCRQGDYRKPLLFAIDIMRSHDNCNYVADTRNGFENEPADTQWIFDYFLPQTALTTCKAIFFIIDKDNKLKEELEGQSVELRKQFEVHYCFGLDEVKHLV
jgi:GTP-dependent phosphoenolpyruvate carboxykinase